MSVATRGIDCAAAVTAAAAEILRAEGYSFVGRYLVPKAYSKALTREEVDTIHAAGLGILLVWETSASRMRVGAAAGREDGARAMERALELGVSRDAALYFAADFDARAEDMPSIREYMLAARQQTVGYRIGVYGSFAVVEAMRAVPCISAFWQCVGWSGGRRSDASSVYQAHWQGTAECKALAAKVGFDVDINECSDLIQAGIWLPEKGEEKEMENVRYDTLAEMPGWAKPTVRKLVDQGHLRGSGGRPDEGGHPMDLSLSLDMIRILVILDRAGVFGA